MTQPNVVNQTNLVNPTKLVLSVHRCHGTGSGSPYATLHYAVWCVIARAARGVRGAVFRDAGG